MKRVILTIGIIIMIIAARLCWGQATQGVIEYESKINLHRRLPPERADMKAMIPEFRTSRSQLLFNETESLYKPVLEDEDEDFDNGAGVRMRMARPYSETYIDQSTRTQLVKQDFMGKDYLIIDSVKLAPWKLGDEVKTIQGYECRQAYYMDEENKQTVTAWYTTELRPFLGPEGFNTLPGAVLAVDVNNEERVIVASKIDLRELKKSELKMPKGGQETTRAEFRQIMDEQMKKMGGNGIVIRHN
jgi:GLPGLI family protein